MAGLNEDTIIANKRTTAAPASDEEFFNSLDAAAAQPTAPEGSIFDNAAPAAGMAAFGAGAADMAAQQEAQPIDFRTDMGKCAGSGQCRTICSRSLKTSA